MNSSSPSPVHVIGGGLAGSEAAWQIASAGVPVLLDGCQGIVHTKVCLLYTSPSPRDS